MARSAWNFLGRLTGRGRQAHEGSVSKGNAVKNVSDDNQDRILLIPPDEPETSTTNPGLASHQAVGNSSVVEADPAQTTTILAEAEHDGVALEAPTASSRAENETAISTKTGEKPAGSADRATKKAAATKSSADGAVTQPAASDELIVLDREIQELRRQLADKLRSQNAQLKKMLDRSNR